MKMRTWNTALLLMALAAGLGAATLQDWSGVEIGRTVGTYDDGKGSKVSLDLVKGPEKGSRALRMRDDLVQWGGFWSVVEQGDLTGDTALRFKAKADPTGRYTVMLTDAQKNQVQAEVRVGATGWQTFTLPLDRFKKSPWTLPDAPKDGHFDASHVVNLVVSPERKGSTELELGPVELLQGKVEAETGLRDGSGPDGILAVQDFESLGTGYGTFQDDKTGCKVSLEAVPDPDRKGNTVGRIRYDLKEGGWLGVWMRTGDAWGGQDWSAGKYLTLKVKSDKPVDLQLAFNDANQNAYVGPTLHADGTGRWQTLKAPLSLFKLNPYYQPKDAKKGAPLDLSHIDTFNLGVESPGEGSFLVDEVLLHTHD